MTDFRRRLRYHQAHWREATRAPHRLAAHRTAARRRPGATRREPPPARLRPRDRRELSHRRSPRRGEGPNVLSIEPHQSFDHQRLWADLLSSEALAFNLFGDLAADLELADRAVHAWWPDTPGTVREVRFAHSPGRFDPAFLNSLRAFDAAVVLDLGRRDAGIVASTSSTTRGSSRRRQAEQPAALSRGRRAVRRLRTRARSTRSRDDRSSP